MGVGEIKNKDKLSPAELELGLSLSILFHLMAQFLSNSPLKFSKLYTFLFSGVAFMVGFGFMAMVGIETLCEKMGEKYEKVTGKPREPEKDPASLVGTFSRYK